MWEMRKKRISQRWLKLLLSVTIRWTYSNSGRVSMWGRETGCGGRADTKFGFRHTEFETPLKQCAANMSKGHCESSFVAQENEWLFLETKS